MKDSRFKITSEQTLRLAEMRDIVAKALPQEAARSVEFSSASYPVCLECQGQCLGTCYPGCQSCVGGCAVFCWNDCTTQAP